MKQINSEQRRIQIIRPLYILFLLLILIACSQKKKEQRNANTNSEIIISKSYGSDSDKILTFEGSEIKSSITQVIDGSSCVNNIYLSFIPLSDKEIEITNISGQMKWLVNNKVIQSPFLLSHITPILNIGEERIDGNSYTTGSSIPDKFKIISGENNSLLYNIEFSDSTNNNIPKNVDRIVIDFRIDLSTAGKTKRYLKTVDFDAVTHKSRIPPGRND